MEQVFKAEIIEALSQLHHQIPHLADRLGWGAADALDSWREALQKKLLPRLMPDFPVTAAICGGGSSGKSTLFNTLAGAHISPTGGTAGINRRVLLALNAEYESRENFLPALFQPFGSSPRRLTQSHELTRPGDPLCVLLPQMPKNMVLLDTPDFDTGAGGVYTNRELARQSLQAADVLIYIFTNANYNNRDNTDFIARMLTGVGIRECFLVYRVYPSFGDDEVHDHAMTVARNLYGAHAESHVRGIYRADEDNAVAAGQRLMTLTPVRPGDPDLGLALARIDPHQVRRELFRSTLKEVLRQAEVFCEQARLDRTGMALYLDALRGCQSHCAHQALTHFPMDHVLRRFAQVWVDTDPGYIKAMRRTGHVVEWPFKTILNTVRWITRSEAKQPSREAVQGFKRELERDLLSSANQLYKNAVDPGITVVLPAGDPAVRRMQAAIATLTDAGRPDYQHLVAKSPGMLEFHVPASVALRAVQENLRQKDWKTALSTIMAQKERIVSFSEHLEGELRHLAQHLRSKMGFTARLRQTFSAVLNVLPATAAVTYILATGDPLGAAGIKVKLTGLFGLHDLYALVAIPATAGMKQADRKQLEELLAPVARSWLEHKLQAVVSLFEDQITGEIIARAEQTLSETGDLIHQARQGIGTCRAHLRSAP